MATIPGVCPASTSGSAAPPRALPRASPRGPRAFLAGPKRERGEIRERRAQGEGPAAVRGPPRAAPRRRRRRRRVAVARWARALRRPRPRIRRGGGHDPERSQRQLLPRRPRAHPRGQGSIRALVRRRRHDLRRGARRIIEHRAGRVQDGAHPAAREAGESRRRRGRRRAGRVDPGQIQPRQPLQLPDQPREHVAVVSRGEAPGALRGRRADRGGPAVAGNRGGARVRAEPPDGLQRARQERRERRATVHLGLVQTPRRRLPGGEARRGRTRGEGRLSCPWTLPSSR